MNYDRNKKYFENAKISIKGIVIGIILGIIAFAMKKVVGIIIFALVGVYIYTKVGGPVDGDIDREYKKGLKDIVSKGLDKLGLDEEQVNLIEPVVISGCYFNNIGSNVKTRKGKDGYWRTSNYEVAVIYFGEEQLYSYNYRFSIIGNEKNESTDEYFYKDIVSISTKSDSIELENKEVINLEYFRLTTSGGTSIECSLRDRMGIENQIKGMKQLLREKKATNN